MKIKTVKKVVIILCFLCLFTYGLPRINFGAEASGGAGSFFSGVRSVTEEEIHQYAADNYLTNYFCNLRYGLCINHAFYCVFVALGMQLTYLDNWCGGTLHVTEAATILSQNSMADYTLQESPGVASEDLMYLLANYSDEYETTPLPNSQIRGIANTGMINLNIDHLFDYIHNAGEATQLIELIDKGIPVMACIYGHASVAFGYNRERGEIYLHSGYLEDNPYGYSRLVAISISSSFDYYCALEPLSNVTHPEECEGNYLYIDENGNETAHCPCELEEHPAHLGKYAHGYTYTTGGHTETCPVNGEIATCEHTLQMNGNYGENTHQKSCVCGYAVEEAHAIALWYVDEERHQKTCACGYESTELHECDYYCLNGGWHSVYCACFGEQNEPHYPHYEVVLIDGEYYYQCSACGYTEPYFSLGW